MWVSQSVGLERNQPSRSHRGAHKQRLRSTARDRKASRERMKSRSGGEEAAMGYCTVDDKRRPTWQSGVHRRALVRRAGDVPA